MHPVGFMLSQNADCADRRSFTSIQVNVCRAYVQFSVQQFVRLFVRPSTFHVDRFCAPHNTNTLGLDLIIFSRIAGQVKLACCVEECDLSLPWFLGYLPLQLWVVRFCALQSCSTFWGILMITDKYSKIPILRPPLGLSKSGL